MLVLREATERPECVEAGYAWLVGCDPTRIVAAVERLTRTLEEGRFHVPGNPYGDARASGRIANYFAGLPVEEFEAFGADRELTPEHASLQTLSH